LRPATGKKLGQLLHQMVSPQPDLVGMDAELARDMGDRLLPLGCFKSHSGLEGRVVRLPHTRKHTIPPFEIWQAQNPLIPPVQFLGSSSVHDCQEPLKQFADGYFDRILAIHVLEHLTNLPAAIREAYRLLDKKSGIFSILIPCEGGFVYHLARRLSAQRIFELRYKQSYKWFIEREHINLPREIIEEVEKYFTIENKTTFPFPFMPGFAFNLVIGLTMKPKSSWLA